MYVWLLIVKSVYKEFVYNKIVGILEYNYMNKVRNFYSLDFI